MKRHEIQRELRAARIEAQTAMEDYIHSIRNAPHTALSQALLRARAYQSLLDDPDNEFALKLLQDVEGGLNVCVWRNRLSGYDEL